MSTRGLITRNPITGAVLSDITSLMTRVLGYVAVPANQAGFLDHSGFATGTPFAVGYAGGVPNIGSSQTYPTHTIQGTRLSWNSAPLSTTIVYGVYSGPTSGKTGSGLPGVRYINAAGATQIDSFYANHCVLTSGGVNLPAGGSMNIVVAGTAPVVAYRGTNVVTVLQQIRNGDGTWTMTLGAGAYAAAGTYFVFDVPGDGAQRFPTLVGQRIRNRTTGALLYDSRLKYLRFNSLRANAAEDQVPVTLMRTQLAQDNLAALVDPGLWFRQSQRQVNDGQGGIQYQDVYSPYFCGAGVNGTVLTEASVTVGGESPIVPAYTSSGRTILVDISNF